MARNQENLAFADRLKQALKRSAKRMETPSELALQFNLNHLGSQVTNQAVQKWLTGSSKPSPDKIETLALMCKVSAQWLRYGIPEARPSAPRPASVRAQGGLQNAPSPDEALLLARFRVLSAHQRKLVSDLVEQLALDWEMWSDADE
jgi:hypothetical protein